MAGKIRTVKPDFFTSGDATAVSRDARLLWIGLWVFADDAGRLKASVREVKNRVFPGDDDLTLERVESLIGELADAGRIVRYEADGERFLCTPNFKKHQRIDKRFEQIRYPAPPCANTACSLRAHESTPCALRAPRESTAGPPREHDEDTTRTPREHHVDPVCPPRALVVSPCEPGAGSSPPIQIQSPPIPDARPREVTDPATDLGRWVLWLSLRKDAGHSDDAPASQPNLERLWQATERGGAERLKQSPTEAYTTLLRAWLTCPLDALPSPGKGRAYPLDRSAVWLNSSVAAALIEFVARGTKPASTSLDERARRKALAATRDARTA